jgi:hypothetical protein
VRLVEVIWASLILVLMTPETARATGVDVDKMPGSVAKAMVALKRGHHVIVLSPGASERDGSQGGEASSSACVAGRTLTDTGRLQASGIGKLLAREGVRVGRIASTPQCHGLETAERIADETRTGRPDQLEFLNELNSARVWDHRSQTRALRRLARTAPQPGTNTVVVTQRSNMVDAFGLGVAGPSDDELIILRAVAVGSNAPYQVAYRLSVRDLSAYAHARQRNVGVTP